MPIYTRTGDKGKTSLFDGTRVLKSHIRVESYGTIDELNSLIGVVIAHIRSKNGSVLKVKKQLQHIQNDLLDIGSALAMPGDLPVVGLADRTEEFEKVIDALTEKMPELKNFILPGGSGTGSLLHVARTIARRAERRIVDLMQIDSIDEQIVIYCNRLSDLLFTYARFINFIEKEKEEMWIKK